MSERPRSRKKHLVEGTVQKIERKGEGLNLERNGVNTGFIKRMLTRFRKNRNNG